MLTNGLLSQYSTKLHYILQKFDSLATKAMNELVERVKDVFDKVVKCIRKQAYTNIVGGIGGGVCSLGAGFLSTQTLKDVGSAVGKVIGSVKDVTNTFIEATKTQYSQESQLKREHELERMRNHKGEVSNTRAKLEEHISKTLDTESKGYHQN